ncbi:MAG: SDR family oxidoreductase [Elusimicrobiota bacterium]|jgi:3-oxoacyl-[acyl-carrier protein] reductase|nr:SDR family oxidoreductase [Elusimicrobiota bacterium]
MSKKILFVIGASSDMGMELIRKVYLKYDVIIAHYRQLSKQLEQLQEFCEDGVVSKISLTQADLISEDETKNMISEICGRGLFPTHIVHFPFPKTDNSKFVKTDWSVFQDMWNIGFRSLTLIAQSFIPRMIKEGGGKIVVMLSKALNNAAPKYCAHYTSVKYAMWGLVKSLSVEYADKNINVNAISPGWVDTKYNSNQHTIVVERNLANSPLKKYMQSSDIIPTIEFLLSEKANSINGQNIFITGGE